MRTNLAEDHPVHASELVFDNPILFARGVIWAIGLSLPVWLIVGWLLIAD